MIAWSDGDAEHNHYRLLTLPADIPFEPIVDLTKQRWRTERDYLELKQGVGLGHYERRGWRSYSHHASLCVAAYRLQLSKKEKIPPSEPARAGCGTQSAVSDDYLPRGSPAPLAATRPKLDRDVTYPTRTQLAERFAMLPMLRTITPETPQAGMT
jgi:hypothetical protein